MIDVVQEKIERGDSLFQTALDLFPFLGGDNSRNQIEGKNSLGPLRIVVNSEGDALAQESERSQLTFAIEFVFLQLGETLQQSLVMRPGLSRRTKHFVVEFAGIVFGEEFDHEISCVAASRARNKKER